MRFDFVVAVMEGKALPHFKGGESTDDLSFFAVVPEHKSRA